MKKNVTEEINEKEVNEAKEVKVAKAKKQIKFKAWVRNKDTKELEEIEVVAPNLSELATAIRKEGKYSFRIASIPEKFDEAKERWIKMNAASIAYHSKKSSGKNVVKMKKLIELIKDCDEELKKEIYSLFNLERYE